MSPIGLLNSRGIPDRKHYESGTVDFFVNSLNIKLVKDFFSRGYFKGRNAGSIAQARTSEVQMPAFLPHDCIFLVEWRGFWVGE